MHMKISSAKRRPFCPGGDELDLTLNNMGRAGDGSLWFDIELYGSGWGWFLTVSHWMIWVGLGMVLYDFTLTNMTRAGDGCLRFDIE